VGRQQEPLYAQLVRHQQLRMTASNAFRFHEVAGAEVLDAGGVERDHLLQTMLPIRSLTCRVPLSTEAPH
jgi:hypothetical protein